MPDLASKPWAAPGLPPEERSLEIIFDSDLTSGMIQEAIEAAVVDTLQWSDADQPIQEDSYIEAAHPTKTGNHDRFMEALRMVTAKRSKYGLVNLVNYLLYSRDQARDSFRSLDEQQRKWAFEAEDKQIELERQLKAATDALPTWKPIDETPTVHGLYAVVGEDVDGEGFSFTERWRGEIRDWINDCWQVTHYCGPLPDSPIEVTRISGEEITGFLTVAAEKESN